MLKIHVHNEVWLLCHNIKIHCPCEKLDYYSLRPCFTCKQINSITYRLYLPKSMKMHLVFYVSLLESYKTMNILESRKMPPLHAKVDNNQEYEVEEVLDSRQH